MKRLIAMSGMAIGLILSAPAMAQVTTYTNAGTFAAAATIINLETFESYPNGVNAPGTLNANGISILPVTNDLYIAPAGTGFYAVVPTSKTLTANGNENFRFALTNGAGFGAIGFDLYTNGYGAPSVSLYGTGGALIQTIVIPQASNTLGFFGVTSTTAIAYITYTAVNGQIVDTGLDNIRIGAASTAVPEPATWGMMILGFGVMGGALRRRGSDPVAAKARQTG